MEVDRSKVPVAAAEPRLHHEVEPDLIERLATRAVVEPAQGNGGLIVLAPERSVEGRRAAALKPWAEGKKRQREGQSRNPDGSLFDQQLKRLLVVG